MGLEPGTWVDRFLVEATLGIGGMGTVYRVRHRELETVHALKVPHEATPGRIAQLRKEARIQARIRHPNVVSVTDVVDADGIPALLMEYVPGPSLDELLRTTRVPRFEMELLVPGLLAGVGALHDDGVVHRDLKPGNVLLARYGRRVVPKLADFGLAEGPGGDFPEAVGAARDFGTPSYMAPEQLSAPTHTDPRVDIYALGAVLYELATGKRALSSDDPREVVEAARRGLVTPVRRLAPDLPDRMAHAIERALSPDPEARPRSCSELWRVWAGPEAPSLSRAARPSLSWRGVWLDELEQIGPPAVSGPIPGPPDWASSSSDWSAPPRPVAPIRRRRHRRPSRPIVAVGIGLLTALALCAGWLLGPGAAWLAAW